MTIIYDFLVTVPPLLCPQSLRRSIIDCICGWIQIKPRVGYKIDLGKKSSKQQIKFITNLTHIHHFDMAMDTFRPSICLRMDASSGGSTWMRRTWPGLWTLEDLELVLELELQLEATLAGTDTLILLLASLTACNFSWLALPRLSPFNGRKRTLGGKWRKGIEWDGGSGMGMAIAHILQPVS